MVERSLAFVEPKSGFGSGGFGGGGVDDEWVAAVDSPVMPLDKTAIRLELNGAWCVAASPQGEKPAVDPYSSAWASGHLDVASSWLADLAAPRSEPVFDDVLPPEARPPWEKAMTVRPTFVICESVLPSPLPTRQAPQPQPSSQDRVSQRRKVPGRRKARLPR